MPNWCFSQVVFDGNKEEIQSLNETMDRLEKLDKPSVENGFGNTWLGCLVDAIGEDWQKIYCRGSWSGLQMEIDDEVGILRFSTETAWGPMLEVFDAICRKYQSLSYYFMSEEPGMCEYLTNDTEQKYFTDKYLVDICTPDEEYLTEYFEDFEDVLAYINNEFGECVKSYDCISKMEDRWQEENPDTYCNIHEFIYV